MERMNLFKRFTGALSSWSFSSLRVLGQATYSKLIQIHQQSPACGLGVRSENRSVDDVNEAFVVVEVVDAAKVASCHSFHVPILWPSLCQNQKDLFVDCVIACTQRRLDCGAQDISAATQIIALFWQATTLITIMQGNHHLQLLSSAGHPLLLRRMIRPSRFAQTVLRLSPSPRSEVAEWAWYSSSRNDFTCFSNKVISTSATFVVPSSFSESKLSSSP